MQFVPLSENLAAAARLVHQGFTKNSTRSTHEPDQVLAQPRRSVGGIAVSRQDTAGIILEMRTESMQRCVTCHVPSQAYPGFCRLTTFPTKLQHAGYFDVE